MHRTLFISNINTPNVSRLKTSLSALLIVLDIFKNPKYVIFYLPILFVLSNCGGGSTGGNDLGTYRDTTTGSYGTEYNNQAGLTQLKIDSLNNYGYTGKSIKVAVVDSGIDSSHSEFAGKTIAGKNFGGSTGGYGTDTHGHGTHVASIIGANRDAVGMRGIAYNATLYDYKLADDAGNFIGAGTDSRLASVFNQLSIDDIQVSNNSWGYSTSITSVTESYLRNTGPLTIAAAKSAIDNGTIIIFAAGNDGKNQVSFNSGLPYHISELADSWLTVVSVDPDNVETDYTNQCGVAAALCVTAPGGGDSQSTEGIYAAKTGGGYVRLSGTSMAAPHVSGLAAVLMHKFPSLTNKQIVSRIKETSSLSGLTGSDGQTLASNGEAVMQAIFGHGLVNQTAASSQIGSLNVALGNNFFEGEKVNIENSKLLLPSYLPASVISAIKKDTFVAFDSYDGANFFTGGDAIYAESANLNNSHTLGYFTNSLSSKFNKRVNANSFRIGAINKVKVNYGTTNQSLSMMSSDFWGDKIGMIAMPSFFEPTHVKKIGISKDLNKNLTLSSYSQYNTWGGVNINGHGLGIKWAPHQEMSISANISKIKSNINLTAGSNDATQLTTVDLIGFNLKAKLSSKANFFGNISQYGLNKVLPTPSSYGLSDTAYLSQTYGIEARSAIGQRLSIGVYNEGSLSNGTIDVTSAVGRASDGTVHFQTKSYEAEKGPQDFGIFIAGSVPFKNKTAENGALNFNYQSPTNDIKSFGNIGVNLSIVF